MFENSLKLDSSLINETSARFANKLFERHPEFKKYARMQDKDNEGKYNLVMEIISPTNKPELNIGIWVDSIEPSLGFGPSHTHGEVEAAETNCKDMDKAILALLEQILNDILVVLTDIGGKYEGSSRWLNIQRSNSIADYLTDKYSPDSIKLQSWSGNIDRTVSLNEIKIRDQGVRLLD